MYVKFGAKVASKTRIMSAVRFLDKTLFAKKRKISKNGKKIILLHVQPQKSKIVESG